MNNKVQVKQIVNYLGHSLVDIKGSSENIFVDNVADIEHTTETTLDWVNPRHPEFQQNAETSPAKVLVVDTSVDYNALLSSQNKVLLVVDNPRLTMAKIITEFFLDKKNSYIHPSANIDPKAEIAPSAYIDAGCVIGRAIIGKNTVVRGNVTIYDNVTIGDNCLIQAGAVIGTDGLGCNRESDGTLVKFPHLGGICIGNNVEIGANCQIAKGALSNTIISDGCKINGMCFIAHNCILGKNVWITGSTMLSGSTHVEENVTIYSRVVVREQILIGKGATIGMGSIVTKNVPAGETWFGCPAKKKE